MPTPPTGTITFLFTDIQGSTRLWEEHPDAMGRALERHDALMRQTIEGHNGVVFKTIGDAFCAAFAVAPDALLAALAAQRALRTEVWPEPIVLKVRMALHTGAAQSRDNDYFGQPLNRVARLLSTGHGGQVLLTSIVSDLCVNALPENVTLLDLGVHTLRDLEQRENVFQLMHRDLSADFPPLKTLHSRPNNLPQQLTSFIGREKEIAESKSLLVKTRLLTLTGSGGCGKSRLALEIAADVLDVYADGVWLVELASLSDPGLVASTIAQTLGIQEQAGRQIEQTLLEGLKNNSMLLLLDNCEHLVAACAQLVTALLRSCPQVRVLVTSREALGVGGEQNYRVPSLTVPDLKQAVTLQNLPQYEAVRLFIDRAGAHKSDFAVTNANAPSLAQLCHRLDGIPLAIELAAARVRSLPVEAINTRLDQRFRLLTGGDRAALPRQQTLRALIDWSYDLLNVQEKLLLGRVCVFAGGWTLEAAEAVCSADEGKRKDIKGKGKREEREGKREEGRVDAQEVQKVGTWGQGESKRQEDASDSLPSPLFPLPSYEVLDLLTGLVDKSLVIVDSRESTARYRLLETVRQYGWERLLQSGESEMFREQHRDYFLALAEAAEPQLVGAYQGEWLDRLEAEHENLRTALQQSLMDGGSPEGLRLCGALQRYWWTRGHYQEGREWCERALETEWGRERSPACAKALRAAGSLAHRQGDNASARSYLEESLTLSREFGDRAGIAGALNNLGSVVSQLGDYAVAQACYEESLILSRELGDRNGVANALNNLGHMASLRGDIASVMAYHEESLAIRREIGDPNGIATSLNNLGTIASIQGEYVSAMAYHIEGLALFRQLGDRNGISNTLNNMGNVACDQGDYVMGRAYHEESLAIRREIGDQKGVASSLINLGTVVCDQGDYVSAMAYHEESLALFRRLGDRNGIAHAVINLGNVAYFQGNYDSALSYYTECLAIRRELGERNGIADLLNNLGTIALLQGDDASALAYQVESLTIRREIGDWSRVATSLSAFADLAVKDRRADRAIVLWASAEALRQRLGAPRPPNERESHEREVALVRQALGEEAFSVAWATGATMTLEQAMDYALQNSVEERP